MTDDERPEHLSEPDADQSWPIGFIALLVAGGLYLLFRFVGLAADLIDWISG